MSSDPERDAAILYAVAYHDPSFDECVISPPIDKRRRNDRPSPPKLESISQPFTTEPVSTLGDLERLPREITSAICLHLDLVSCIRLRQANRLARQVVSSVPEYRAVADHAREAMHAILRTGMGDGWTLIELYRPLITKGCVGCKGFGHYIYLPLAARCCHPCLSTSSALRTVSLASISKFAGVPADQLRRQVRVVTTVPGKYQIPQRKSGQRLELVSASGAASALKSLGVSDVTSSTAAYVGKDAPEARYMASTILPYLDRATGEVEHGLSCACCNSLTRMPPSQEIYRRRGVVYSKQGMLDHFANCPASQDLWVKRREEYTRWLKWLREKQGVEAEATLS